MIWLVAAWAVGGPEEAGVRRRPRPGTDEAEACRHNYCQAQPGSSSGNKYSDHISYSLFLHVLLCAACMTEKHILCNKYHSTKLNNMYLVIMEWVMLKL